MEITLLSEGKFKERWLEEACSEYLKRLQGEVQVHYLWAKDSGQLEKLAQRQRRLICLDIYGKEYSSEAFAHFLEHQFEQASQLCFVIGGPTGLPTSLKLADFPLISLSKMTLTHQCTRLILLEQIYRAFSIMNGSPYHK